MNTTGNCLDILLGAGFDEFEIRIPSENFDMDYEYLLTLWRNSGDRWQAKVEDWFDNSKTVAHAEASTPAEALWNLTMRDDDDPYSGDPSAIPGRLKVLAASLWVKATHKTLRAEVDKAAEADKAVRTASEVYERAMANRDALFDPFGTAAR